MRFTGNIGKLLRLSAQNRALTQRPSTLSRACLRSSTTSGKNTPPSVEDTLEKNSPSASSKGTSSPKKYVRVLERDIDGNIVSSAAFRRLPLLAPAASNPVAAPLPFVLRKKSASVEVRKPLVNPASFANEALEAVISTWQNPKYLQEGEAPLPNASPEVETSAVELIVAELSRFKDGLGEHALVQAVDSDTQDVLVEAGLCSREEAPTFLNANSNVAWYDLVSPAKRITAQLIEGTGYQPNQTQLKKAKHELMGFFVRQLFELRRDNNLGAVILKGFDRPLVLFRGCAMAGVEETNSALRNLIERANVTDIANLYAGNYPLHDLIEKEAEVCDEYGAGVVYHDERKQVPLREWRESVAHADGAKTAEIVSEVIKDIVLPGGRPPRGNIFIHCGGGMHRTGMIVGIIRRYFNDDSIETIKADIQRHVAWKSEEDKGGYEASNIRFIEEFDLSVLDRVLKSGSATTACRDAA